MEIDGTSLSGIDLLEMPVWLVDVGKAEILWRNRAAARLGLAPRSAADAGTGRDRLAGLLVARLGSSPETAQTGATIPITLIDGEGRVGTYRCRRVAATGLAGGGRMLVEGWPEADAGADKGLESLLSYSAAILRASVDGAGAEALLNRILAMVETTMPEAVCSVVLLDASGRRIGLSLGPRLPDSYHAAVTGIEVGPGAGSCGTAIHLRQRVVAADIATHPHWAPYRDLVLALGLRACWSEPIRTADDTVIGSFATYMRAPGAPMLRQIRIAEAAANLASIALEAERSRTEARVATQRLAASEATLRSLLDASPSVIFLKDRAGRYRTINAAYTRTYGIPAESVIGKTAEEVLGLEKATPYREMDRALSEAVPVVSRRIENPNLAGLVQDVTKFLVRGADGGVEGIGTIATDVSALHQTERALAVLSERLSLAVEAAGIGVFDYDIATGDLYCNARMAEICGVESRRHAMTRPEDWMALVHPGDAALVRQRFASARQGDVLAHTQFRILREDGTVRHVRSAARVIREDGRPARVIGANLDVTADVEMAEALAARSREAEAANAAKSRFLANVSHELRTPLNGVLGCAQLMAHTDLDPMQRRHLDVIEASGTALLDLIEDLLDIGRIEAGVVVLEKRPLEVSALIDTVVRIARDMAEAGELSISAGVAGSLAPRRLGDARRIRQVLLNLVGNAMKFTERGWVSIEAEPGPGDQVRFSVTDTGPGIPSDKQELIFERFGRIESETGTRKPGTGLGLAIVRDLVGLMGGSIAVENAPGAGARFVVTLPLPPAGAAEEGPTLTDAGLAAPPGRGG